MRAPRGVLACGLVAVLASAAAADGRPRVGYVFPAGGRQGTTFLVTVGGQFLGSWKGEYFIDVQQPHFTGGGIQAKVRNDIRILTGQEAQMLQEKLERLRKQGSKDAGALKEVFEVQKKLFLARAEFARREAQPALADSVTLEVTVAADAEPGRRELRLETPRGVSNPVAFTVGRLPEFRAKEAEPVFDPRDMRHGLIRQPARDEMTVTLPAVVNGQILPRDPEVFSYAPDRATFGTADRYRFEAHQGQQIVLAASARELIPYLPDAVPGWFQATLALYDAAGRQVAFSDDDRFHPDPVILFRVPADGAYVVEIKDAIHRGRPDFVYRLTMGELPYITGVFPLGGRAGAATTVKFSGWNLPVETLTLNDKEMTPGVRPLSVRKGDVTSNALPFVVDTLPECLEREPNDAMQTAQAVTLPVVVNGRIDRAGDWDVFRFEGRAGQEVVAEVAARRLESPLDSVLEVVDAAGKRLGFNDDHEDKFDDRRTHHADSLIRVRLPADGAYCVRLGDAQRHGGPEYAYRLRLSEPRPDFELRVTPSCLNAINWRLNPLAVHVRRVDGFNGPIALRFRGEPYGLVLGGGVVPEGQERVGLTLAVAPKISGELVRPCLEGRATIDGKEVVHPAVPADEVTQAFFYKHVVPAGEMILVPEDRVQFREEAARAAGEGKPVKPPAAGRSFHIPMEVLSEQPVKIPAGGTATVLVRMSWSRNGQIQVDLSDPPEGIGVERVSWAERGLTLVLRGEAGKVKAGLRGNLMANAFLQTTEKEKDGKTREVRQLIGPLPAMPFEVVKP